jgi:predicted enzyme related to lactoylglutathione lyase
MNRSGPPYTLRSAHIFVDDLGLANEFYVATLGMPLIYAGQGFLILETGSCQLMIFENTDGTEPVGVGTGLHFGVANIDELYQELCLKGVRFLGAPATHDWGGRMVSFLDCSGNSLSFVQYPEA